MLQLLLNIAPNGSEWSVSPPGLCNPEERAWFGGHQTDVDVVEKKTPCLYWGQSPDPSVFQSII